MERAGPEARACPECGGFAIHTWQCSRRRDLPLPDVARIDDSKDEADEASLQARLDRVERRLEVAEQQMSNKLRATEFFSKEREAAAQDRIAELEQLNASLQKELAELRARLSQ